jgi:repressor of nif and glnA expression
MRRDRKLAEEILRTLVFDDSSTMSVNTLTSKVEGKASDSAVLYHVSLLEDVGLVEIPSNGYIRVTSAGQDRVENTDKQDPMATWAILGN